MATRVIKVPDDMDVASAAEQGAAALCQGLLVGFPTETVYGVAAVATLPKAMGRLRELKARPKRPFSVHLGRPQDAGRYVQPMPPAARRLIEKAWPGPVTLLVATGGSLADARLRRRAGLYERLCHEGVIGLRCPDEPVAQAMLCRLDQPVVAPSANRARGPSPRTAEDVLAALDGQIDLLIDAGPARYGRDSTVVRCQGRDWTVVREGVYGAAAIGRLMRRTVLFVCTGNTCRSPMAAGLAKKLLAERLGCKVRDLPRKGYKVLSAGAFGTDGARASPEAVKAAGELGADISRHRSRRLTKELIRRADLVFCMTDSHVETAVRLAPEAKGKLRRLDPQGAVPDPIGGGAALYRRVARQIDKALRNALAEGSTEGLS